MSELSSEQSEMSSVSEASMLLRRVAPREFGGSVKAAIRRAAEQFGFNYSRTKDLWYGTARRIDAREMDALRSAAKEAQSTAERLLALRDALAAKDAAFHRADIDALERALCRMGCDVRARDFRRPENDADEARG